MSMVHASGGLSTPPSPHLKSEGAIICGMARATLPASDIDWDAFEGNYDLIRDKIEALYPKLFAKFNPTSVSRAASTFTTGRANSSGTPPMDARISWIARESARIRPRGASMPSR
jgi:hypothetical protein